MIIYQVMWKNPMNNVTGCIKSTFDKAEAEKILKDRKNKEIGIPWKYWIQEKTF